MKDIKLILVAILAFVAVSLADPSTTSIDGRQYYEIGSSDDLFWFANKVNSGDTAISAILTADLDLDFKTWTPIGMDTTCAFDGIFDGAGHSVSGIKVTQKNYAGLFGVLDFGTVKNLVIENSTIYGYYVGKDIHDNYSYGYLGGAAGYAKESSTIRNVINRATHIGATNAPTSGQTHSFYMGGIVGLTKGNIVNCTNEADLSLSKNDYHENIGGIGGVASSYGNQVDSLKNTGTIKGLQETGGIFGRCRSVTNAINSGTVEGKVFVGGICGSGDVSKSINKGLVKGNGNGIDTLRVGGIVGSGSVESSQNQGKIEVSTGGTASFIGGISGESDDMKFSMNYGDISANTTTNLYVGGIIGFAKITTNSFGEGTVGYCGNFGGISAQTQTSKEARVGGVVGEIQITRGNIFKISNVFNQGKLHSSQYAAGIVSELPQDSVKIRNFYVATSEIYAPNAAAFVNYNSLTATLQNGYFDGTLLEGIPLYTENVGVGKDLFVVNTEILQSDSLAYLLELENCGGDRNNCRAEGHWSRDGKYPIFADSLHNPTYQVIFISHKNCTTSSCELDSNKRYTTYEGHVKSVPELTDGGVWVLHAQNQGSVKKYTTSELKDFVFEWSDSLVFASYQNCNDLASTDIGCCLNYMVDFLEEYVDAYNRYFLSMHGISILMNDPEYAETVNNCSDDNKDGVLNWKDPSSNFSFVYNNKVTSLNSFKQYLNSSSSNQTSESSSSITQGESSSSITQSESSSSIEQNEVKTKEDLPNCNSKRFGVVYYVEEEDTDYKCDDYKWIDLLNPQAISNVDLAFQPKVFAKDRSIQIESISAHKRVVVLDAQGRIVKNEMAFSSTNIPVNFAGRYFVMIGKSITAIDVK